MGDRSKSAEQEEVAARDDAVDEAPVSDEIGNVRVVTDEADGAANDAVSPEPQSESAIVVKSAASPSVPPPTNSLVPASQTGAIAGVVQGSRRWVFIAKHYAWTSVRSPRWWFTVVLTLVQVGLISWPLVQLKVGFWPFLVSFSGLLGTQLLKRWKDNQPKERHIVWRNYDERKLALYRLVHATIDRGRMTAPEIATYQRDVLALIASYVRDHRCDWETPTIFANLLVDDGEDLVVIARDQDHRHARARYPKAGMLAAKALASGEPILTGDVYRDYPDTVPGKAYSSVLAIPIHCDGQVVGVVSVDSSQKFHFDLDGSKLVDWLRPFVAMLSWTLPKRAKGLYLPSGVTK